MAHDLSALLRPDGVVRTSELQRRVDRHTISSWVARGRLLRPYPGVVALPDAWDGWRTRALAAVMATGGVLAHASALAVWRLAPAGDDAVHVSVPANRRALRRPGLHVHRAKETPTDELGGLPVTLLPRTLVDCWGWAHCARGSQRSVDTARGAVIETLRDRRVRVPALREELARVPALPGRAALVELVELVSQGCQSELEIWGVRSVLAGAGMPAFQQQYPVRLPFGTVHLDAAIPDLRIAVEMDGAAFHGSAEVRERDIRRDAALAAQGWVVLRFSYRRLRREPEACRREILAVCRARAASALR
ncbi:DUF559 domain-containing protein [Blastococcus sp. TF02A_35]|uniref:DUF559 domain-containing protein n=1 Tax=Blastococcus sp. TF02A-35 TaxID=2559612 RepID=UPI0010739F70|nr:DUF559 domain-containing protein [Blastococcus sp. TF02A_35]TFV46513.1 DUF559 domain-containing protein [Blastococcus sp. TF02A_35]